MSEGNFKSLKTDPKCFEASWNGVKNWEIRVNDRGFQIGDHLHLKETVYTGIEMQSGSPLCYTGRQIKCEVTFILEGYGLQKDWVILSTKIIKKGVLVL